MAAIWICPTQFQNTSVTNNVEKVTKVYAVFKTDAYYLNMVECANVYVYVMATIRIGPSGFRAPSVEAVESVAGHC